MEIGELTCIVPVAMEKMVVAVKNVGAKCDKELMKRDTLQSIGNRAIGRSTLPRNNEAVLSKELYRSKLQNVKPKVDSYWRKPIGMKGGAELVTDREVVTSDKSHKAKVIDEVVVPAVTVVGQKKMLTRSKSVRVVSVTGASVIQRKTSENNVAVGKTKTENAAKEVDKNLAQSKLVKGLGAKENLHEKPIVNSDSKIQCEERDDETIVSKSKRSPSPVAKVYDVDENDGDNLILVSEYVKDIYSYLFELENEQLVPENHLKDQLEVNGRMRSVLIDWISDVTHQFQLLAESFQLAVAIIDLYLSIVNDTKRSELQLVGVAGLFLAAKYEEVYPPSLADFVYITDDAYTGTQICQMERRIFKTLQFNLSRPLPIHFLRRFSKTADAEGSHHGLAKYFVELSLVESDMAHYKPSEIAAASLLLSLNLLKGNHNLSTGLSDKYWTPTLRWHTRYNMNNLQPICRKMAITAYNAPKCKLKAVYTKYQSAKLLKVSIRPELYGPLMTSIISCDK